VTCKRTYYSSRKSNLKGGAGRARDTDRFGGMAPARNGPLAFYASSVKFYDDHDRVTAMTIIF